MTITVQSSRGDKFSASNVSSAIKRSQDYLKDSTDLSEIFRIYVIDKDNPWPGFIAATVHKDADGNIISDVR